ERPLCFSPELHQKAKTVHTPSPEPSPPTPANALEIRGEVAETLFLRYQDLITVLTSDSLSHTQVATLLQKSNQDTQHILQQMVACGLIEQQNGRFRAVSKHVYFRHLHSQIRFMEESLTQKIAASFQNKEHTILENCFLKLPQGGLPQLREQLFEPFLHEKLFSSNQDSAPSTLSSSYDKKMYALLLIGTQRLHPKMHQKTPLRERVLYYFREASLQRADQQHPTPAICLQATLTLHHTKSYLNHQDLLCFQKKIKAHAPQGRGNKPDFNLTYCFTEIPFQFDRTPAISSYPPSLRTQTSIADQHS
ncbi:MAG: hypothetical protein AAGJ35_13180, partial [Myxococcota bacterium]